MLDEGTPISVLIADAPVLVRHGLVALLGHARPTWCCTEVQGEQALHTKIRETAPDLVLLDTTALGVDGLRAARLAFPDTTFAVLSAQDGRDAILASLEAGAQGYILFSTGAAQFVRALETILTGGIHAPASLSGAPIHPPVAEPAQEVRPVAAPPHLTERQRAVFELLAEGCATKTIARRMDLAVGTVKIHLAAIYRSLGVSGRLEAVAKVHRGFAVA